MLSDKIVDSHEYFSDEDTNLILPSDFENLHGVLGENLLMLIREIKKIPTLPNEQFNIVDLDDTIYTRYHTLQLSLLNENRGTAGNETIKERLGGYGEFCRKFYKGTQAVGEFIELSREKTSLILTAGEKEFQSIKLDNIGNGLEKANKLVVDKDYMKPIYLLFYIITDLGYIPGNINIYDDRVEFFNKYAPLLSKILQTNISVNQVTLSQYDTNKIDNISQISYGGLRIQ